MSTLDDKIKKALEVEEEEILTRFDNQQSIHEMLMDTFRGKNRWISILVFVFIFIFLFLSIYCAVKFFEVSTTKELILWAVGFMFGQMVIGMMKIWYWMEMQKNSIAREVKRLELQVVHLVSLLKEQEKK